MRRTWLGVEFVLSHQQSIVDQFVRTLHSGTRLATARALLLANRYKRISTLGVAVRGVWRECAGVVCRFGIDGETDGPGARAGMDLSQSLFVVGFTDQCIIVLCDRVYSAVAVIDVAALPEAHLYQGLSYGLSRILITRPAQSATCEGGSSLSFIDTDLSINQYVFDADRILIW